MHKSTWWHKQTDALITDVNVQLYLLEPLHSNIKFCIHTHVKTRARSHRYGGCPAATGNQDGASCYRSPMTLLIPSWLSLCPAPHIPPINRTACQLILPGFFSLPSIKPRAPKYTVSFHVCTLTKPTHYPTAWHLRLLFFHSVITIFTLSLIKIITLSLSLLLITTKHKPDSNSVVPWNNTNKLVCMSFIYDHLPIRLFQLGRSAPTQ